MFRNPEEKFTIQLEIEGYVVYEEEITPPRYHIMKAMLRGMARRRWPKSEWAIFVVRKREHNTRKDIGCKRRKKQYKYGANNN